MSEFRGEGFSLWCGYPLRLTPGSWLIAAHFCRDSNATFCFGWVGATCTQHEVRDMVRVSREKLSFIVD